MPQVSKGERTAVTVRMPDDEMSNFESIRDQLKVTRGDLLLRAWEFYRENAPESEFKQGAFMFEDYKTA